MVHGTGTAKYLQFISKSKNVSNSRTLLPTFTETITEAQTATLTAPITVTRRVVPQSSSNAQAIIGALFQAAGSLGFGTAFYIFFVLLLILAFQLGYYLWCMLFSPRVRVDTHVNVPWWIALLVMHTYIGGLVPCHFRCILAHGLQLIFHVYFIFFWSAAMSLAFDLSETKSIIAIAFISAILPHMVRPVFHKVFYYYRADEDVIKELEYERQYKEREAKYGVSKNKHSSEFFGNHGNQANGVSQAALDALDNIEFDGDDDGNGSQDWSDDEYNDHNDYSHHNQFDNHRNYRADDVDIDQSQARSGYSGEVAWDHNGDEDDIVDIQHDDLGDDDQFRDDGEAGLDEAPAYDEDFAFVGLYRPSGADSASPARGLRGGVRDRYGAGSDVASSGFAFEDFDSHYGENNTDNASSSSNADDRFYEQRPDENRNYNHGFQNDFDDLEDDPHGNDDGTSHRSEDYREDEVHELASVDHHNDDDVEVDADRDRAIGRPGTAPTHHDDLHISIHQQAPQHYHADPATEDDEVTEASLTTAPYASMNRVATLPPRPPQQPRALPHMPSTSEVDEQESEHNYDEAPQEDNGYDEDEGVAAQEQAVANAAAVSTDFRRLWQQSSARTASNDNNLSNSGNGVAHYMPIPGQTDVERFSAASVDGGDEEFYGSVAASSSYGGVDDGVSDGGATELMVLPIKTYFKRGLIALAVLVVIILIVDYALLNELQSRDNNAFIRATLLAFLLDIAVFQQLYIGIYYVYRRQTDPLRGQSIVYELHPFEGEVREF